MMLSRVAFEALVIGVGFGAVASPRPPFTLSCSLLEPTASIQSIKTTFGTDDIAADSLPLGDTEGDWLPATVVFAHDARRRIAIVWKDTVAKRMPRFIRVSGPTDWRTSEGITIGTSLKELEHLNGKPFHLAGFAFDESGAVTSWDGGKLESLSTPSCGLSMHVNPADSLGPADRKLYEQVQGDSIFSSSHRAMQGLNPRVSDLLIAYR